MSAKAEGGGAPSSVTVWEEKMQVLSTQEGRRGSRWGRGLAGRVKRKNGKQELNLGEDGNVKLGRRGSIGREEKGGGIR